MTVRPRIAAIRFGYGLRLGEAQPADPEAWLESQIARPGPPPTPITTRQAILARAGHIVLRNERNRPGEARNAELRSAVERAGGPIPDRSPLSELVRTGYEAWAARRLTSAEPFRERLVDFWANHFNASRRGGALGMLPPAMEHEAIRPHVTGRFADMLVAVSTHAAMLIYLNNNNSAGPNSRVGMARGAGLNENLAREILELHTLSPAGGYTQNDVQEFAKILSGWRVESDGEPFGVVWREAAHEPGPKFLLGRRFEEGRGSLETALRFLASRPATYRHLAVKLTRHFVADDPPPEAVRAVEAALARSEGDLGEAARALVRLPAAWDPPLGKLRAPQDFVIAAGRAVGLPPDRAEFLITGMTGLNQRPWGAPQPNGWPDTAAAWSAPEGLMRRVDFAYNLAGRFTVDDLRMVTDAALGPLARAETVAAMRVAGSVRDAATILLGSPEFMRR